MHVHLRHLSQDSTFDLFLFNYFPNCFPNFEFPNLACGLSTSAAYMSVLTVYLTSLNSCFCSRPLSEVSLKPLSCDFIFRFEAGKELQNSILEYGLVSSDGCAR